MEELTINKPEEAIQAKEPEEESSRDKLKNDMFVKELGFSIVVEAMIES